MKTSDKAKNALEKATEIRKEVAGLPVLTAYLRDIIEETVRMEGDLLELRRASLNYLDCQVNDKPVVDCLSAGMELREAIVKTAHYEQ